VTTEALLPSAPPAPTVSVVVPLFDNAATVGELCRRVHAAVDPIATHEVLLVVDACPHGSEEAARAVAAADPRVAVVALRARSGQHRAVLAGMEAARGEWLIVMDGDLQDPPEALPSLLAAASGRDAVFAGRHGPYEGRGRRLTAWAFRLLMAAVAGVPRRAGMFFAVRREVAARAARLPVSHPYVVAMIAHVAEKTAIVPVARSARPGGRSAYSGAGRLRVGAQALRCALDLRGQGEGRTQRGRRSAPLAIDGDRKSVV